MVRAIGEPGYCLHRHPYVLLGGIDDAMVEGACPHFWDWAQRIKINRDAVIKFIGSIFVDGSYNQQYLILKGEGQDGKGAMLNCLADFFGPLYAATFSDKVKTERWTTSTYNKRLVAFPDAQNLSFANLEVFKAITGGDSVPFRFLYQEEFSATSKAKFILCTNEDVDVTMMKSDRRRRIYAEMKTASSITSNYLAELKEEAQIFFSWCRTKFLEECELDSPVPVDNSVEDELESDALEEFCGFVDKFCKLGGGETIVQGELYKWFRQCYSKDKRDWRKFKYYMQRELGCTWQRLNNKRVWRGITMKPYLINDANVSSREWM
jgi:putative DNA primase/helicase